MKHFTALITALTIFASLAQAEVLAPATTNAPGKWSASLLGARQTNSNNNSSLSQTIYGLDLSYGLANRTQLDLTYESGNFSGISGMELSLRSLTASLKYNLLLETPVSLAIGASYTSISQQDNFAGSPSGSNYGCKIVVSKMFLPFIPYACLNRSFTSLAGESSATEATLGSVWLIANGFSASVENTWQLQSGGYTSGLFSLTASCNPAL
ncbi:MAG: hypothetical protein ABIH22_03755 [Candidatus Margulisiibacteriota bacterium]